MSISSHFDVIVIGGGPAGISAAVQSARAGARTLLVEKSGLLGGATTLNGVNFPGLFHAWGRQIIAGIGWELVTRSVAESGGSLPDFSTWRGARHWRLQVLVNPALYAALADDLVESSGAELLFHAMPARVEELPDGWQITLCLKEGLRVFQSKVLIDCSGDANAMRLAGYPLRRSEERQPGTLVMQAGGYQTDELDFPALEEAFHRAVDSGELRRSDFTSVQSFLMARGSNQMHVPGVDGETSEGKSRAEVAARQSLRRVVRFLRGQPGLADFRIEHFAPECGIRETASIVGDTCITAADYTAGRVWPDSVCYSFYPIDIHRTNGVGIDVRPLTEGVFPTIPLGALTVRNSRNLLVAGRCASGDREAQSAFRVQASAMAMGQAVGAAAALAARQNLDVRQAPMAAIHEVLTQHGAIVPDLPTISDPTQPPSRQDRELVTT